MICQKCGLSEATIHRQNVVYRQKIEEHLCETCANTSMASVEQVGLPWKLSHSIQYSRDTKIGAIKDIENYVSRLVRSNSSFAWLIIGTVDEDDLIAIQNSDGVPVAIFGTKDSMKVEGVGAVSSFLASRGQNPIEGFLGIGHTCPHKQFLSYIFPPEVQLISGLIRDVLKELYHVTDQDPVRFSYEEQIPA